jgi:hypothetical protein
MKRISAVVLIVLFGVLASYEANAQGPDPIQTIRQQYTSINRSAAKSQKVKKELLGFSAEGGELVAYLKGPSIMKIAATYFGETGRATEEFYYSNDKLIFVFHKDSRYDQPLSGKVVATTENRYYFKDDKLIRWIGEDGKQVPATAPEFAQVESRLLASSKQFVEGAQSKNPTIEGS